jgi:DNA-binding transcriptional regulator YiaG
LLNDPSATADGTDLSAWIGLKIDIHPTMWDIRLMPEVPFLYTFVETRRKRLPMAKRKIKKAYMSAETFAQLMESGRQALEYERGARAGYHVKRVAVPSPPQPMSSVQIARLRKRLNYSQSVFARVLNVSTKTVQAWEQGARMPSDAALKLLTIAKKHPEVLLEA